MLHNLKKVDEISANKPIYTPQLRRII